MPLCQLNVQLFIHVELLLIFHLCGFFQDDKTAFPMNKEQKKTILLS